jgi:hypothetical protein
MTPFGEKGYGLSPLSLQTFALEPLRWSGRWHPGREERQKINIMLITLVGSVTSARSLSPSREFDIEYVEEASSGLKSEPGFPTPPDSEHLNTEADVLCLLH